jgi:hypothetical protein
VEKTLSLSLVDLVVVSQESGDSCTAFDRLVPECVGRKYVLREYDISRVGGHGTNDLSLSDCAERKGNLNPNDWRLGQKTPMAVNSCEGHTGKLS